MAGRFLPQRDVDLITRVSRELVGDKQGNKDGLINHYLFIFSLADISVLDTIILGAMALSVWLHMIMLSLKN